MPSAMALAMVSFSASPPTNGPCLRAMSRAFSKSVCMSIASHARSYPDRLPAIVSAGLDRKSDQNRSLGLVVRASCRKAVIVRGALQSIVQEMGKADPKTWEPAEKVAIAALEPTARDRQRRGPLTAQARRFQANAAHARQRPGPCVCRTSRPKASLVATLGRKRPKNQSNRGAIERALSPSAGRLCF